MSYSKCPICGRFGGLPIVKKNHPGYVWDFRSCRKCKLQYTDTIYERLTRNYVLFMGANIYIWSRSKHSVYADLILTLDELPINEFMKLTEDRIKMMITFG